MSALAAHETKTSSTVITTEQAGGTDDGEVHGEMNGDKKAGGMARSSLWRIGGEERTEEGYDK